MSPNNGQTYFEKIIVDSDTALIQAALFVQELYIVVKHESTGIEREFSGIQAFQGRKRKGGLDSIGGWLGEMNEFFGVDYTREEFTITNHVRLKTDIKDHVEEALKNFSYFVGSIKALNIADDYVLCLDGDKTNFRYDVANILPYKGERKEKPLVFEQLRQRVFDQYKSKIVKSDGYESDDTLAMFGAENQAHFRKTNKYKYVLAYLDKDIKQVWGATLLLNNKEDGVFFITPLQAAHHFAYQLLMGDKGTDNILGIGGLSEETREKYSLRKGKGCGEVSANTILEGVTEIPELFNRVCECYKSYYVGYNEFTTHREEVLQYDWKDYLRENSRLLWMLRTENVEWDIFSDLFDKIGVVYE